MMLEEIVGQEIRQANDEPGGSKYPPVYLAEGAKYDSGYRNKTSIGNVIANLNHFWENFQKGLYGTYNRITAAVTIAEHLRQDIDEYFRTLIHEVYLHKVMQLPDGYAVKVLESWLAATEKQDRYKR